MTDTRHDVRVLYALEAKDPEGLVRVYHRVADVSLSNRPALLQVTAPCGAVLDVPAHDLRGSTLWAYNEVHLGLLQRCKECPTS